MGSLTPQSDAACWNAGDRGLNPDPSSNAIPCRSMIATAPAGSELGALVSGSGKSGMPCVRMHLANARAAARSPGAVTGGAPPFGRYCLHATCAVLNAGDCAICGVI